MLKYIEQGHVAAGWSCKEIDVIQIFYHLFSTTGEAEQLLPDQLAQQTLPRLHPHNQHQTGISQICLTVFWSHNHWNLGLLLQGLLPHLLDQLPKLAHERSMKHQHFWSLSEVTYPQKHRAKFGQRSVCPHGSCCCGDINWEVFLHWCDGKLSEMGTGEEGCLAAHFKVIIFWRDSWIWPATTACRVAGYSVSSSLCHKIYSLKYLSTAAAEFTETSCSPDRQALQANLWSLLEGEAFVK